MHTGRFWAYTLERHPHRKTYSKATEYRARTGGFICKCASAQNTLASTHARTYTHSNFSTPPAASGAVGERESTLTVRVWMCWCKTANIFNWPHRTHFTLACGVLCVGLHFRLCLWCNRACVPTLRGECLRGKKPTHTPSQPYASISSQTQHNTRKHLSLVGSFLCVFPARISYVRNGFIVWFYCAVPTY